MITHTGGCHCGRVRFEMTTREDIEITECNCSICTKAGYLHVIVPKSCFRLLRGEDSLSVYTFNTGAAKHYFCNVCGIKSFYVPRSHPEGYSVNFRCVDTPSFTKTTTTAFDGQEWEAHIGELAPLPE